MFGIGVPCATETLLSNFSLHFMSRKIHIHCGIYQNVRLEYIISSGAISKREHVALMIAWPIETISFLESFPQNSIFTNSSKDGGRNLIAVSVNNSSTEK